MVGDECEVTSCDAGGVRRGLITLLPPHITARPATCRSAEDSVIGEKPRYARILGATAAGEGDGEGEGVGVQWSESPDSCVPSSWRDRNGSSFGKFTASSTLHSAIQLIQAW